MIGGLLFAYITALCGLGWIIAFRGFRSPRSWFALILAFGSSQYLIAYPMALAGVPSHAWLQDHPALTQYLVILALHLTSAWVACEVVSRLHAPRLLMSAPRLAIRGDSLRGVALVLSALGAAASIALSMAGLNGYFVEPSFLTDPPTWIDIARITIALLGSLVFVIYLDQFRRQASVGLLAWLLTAGWSLAGIFAGFKTLVMAPFLFIVLAAWISSRMRTRYILFLIGAIWCSYSIVEPMRDAHRDGMSSTALGALEQVITTSALGPADLAGVLEAFLNRADYAKEAVRALNADHHDLLTSYKQRLDDLYIKLPVIAFVPRSLWPDKPLANLGVEMSTVLDNIPGNSITPSNPVDSYLWAGYAGVAFNAFFGAMFTMLAGHILLRYARDPFAYVPMIVLAVVFSVKDSIMAYFYITSMRIAVLVVVFYSVALFLGLAVQHARRPALR